MPQQPINAMGKGYTHATGRSMRPNKPMNTAAEPEAPRLASPLLEVAAGRRRGLLVALLPATSCRCSPRVIAEALGGLMHRGTSAILCDSGALLRRQCLRYVHRSRTL